MSDRHEDHKRIWFSAYTGNSVSVEDHRTQTQRKARLSYERRLKFIGCLVTVSIFAIVMISVFVTSSPS
jgi:hypothetical protein